MGSQDMDSANGLLRFNDQDDTTMQVTEAAKTSIAPSDAQTNTGPAATTTTGAAPGRPVVPNAQQTARQTNGPDENPDTDTDQSGEPTDKSDEAELARTGTDLNFQPAA